MLNHQTSRDNVHGDKIVSCTDSLLIHCPRCTRKRKYKCHSTKLRSKTNSEHWGEGGASEVLRVQFLSFSSSWEQFG